MEGHFCLGYNGHGLDEMIGGGGAVSEIGTCGPFECKNPTDRGIHLEPLMLRPDYVFVLRLVCGRFHEPEPRTPAALRRYFKDRPGKSRSNLDDVSAGPWGS